MSLAAPSASPNLTGAGPGRCRSPSSSVRTTCCLDHEHLGAHHPRQVHPRPAPDAGPRRQRRPRRGGPPRRTTTRWLRSWTGGQSHLASRWSPSVAAPPWSAAWWPGGTALPGRGRPRPDPALNRLVSLDAQSRTAVLEAGLLGPAAEELLAQARVHAAPLPAVLRVRLHRRLRGHPLQRAVVVRATAASTRWSSGCGSPPRSGPWSWAARRRPRLGPDPRQLVLGSEGAFGVITEVTVTSGLRLPSACTSPGSSRPRRAGGGAARPGPVGAGADRAAPWMRPRPR